MIFDVYVLVLNPNSLTKNILHVCVFVFVRKERESNAKNARHVSNFKTDGAQIFHVCVCVLIYKSGPKTKIFKMHMYPHF